MSSASLPTEDGGREADLLQSAVNDTLRQLCERSPFLLGELIVRIKRDPGSTITVKLLFVPDTVRTEGTIDSTTKWTQSESLDDHGRLVDVGSVAFQPAETVGKGDKAIQLGYPQI